MQDGLSENYKCTGYMLLAVEIEEASIVVLGARLCQRLSQGRIAQGRMVCGYYSGIIQTNIIDTNSQQNTRTDTGSSPPYTYHRKTPTTRPRGRLQTEIQHPGPTLD